MTFRVFIQHADHGAQSAIAVTFAALGIPVYSTLANYHTKVPKGIFVVPPYRTHSSHFKFYLSACNIIILSDNDPAEGQLIIDLLEDRFFVGHIFLVSNCLTWGGSSSSSRSQDTKNCECPFLNPEDYEFRRALPEVQSLKLLEDRLAGLLTSHYITGDPLQPCIRGSILVHGLLYDAYTTEGNTLMELVDFVVENGFLPTLPAQDQYTIPITSCCRLAIELRNVLQNTVEQGVSLRGVCPFRFVVDEIISLPTLLTCINDGVYGYGKLTPKPLSKLELLSAGLSPRIISYCSLRNVPKPNPLDDFSYSNSITYTNYEATNDVVLESVQQILSTSTITETPHIVESIQAYVTLSISRRCPRYTIVLLGNQANFCVEDKAKLLSSELKTPIISLPIALQGLILLGDSAKESSFWAPLFDHDVLPDKPQQPLAPLLPGKGSKGSGEPIAIEDKAAMLVRIVHNLPVTGSTTSALLSAATMAVLSLPVKGFVASILMLYLRSYALVGEGYIFAPGTLSATEFEYLFSTTTESFLSRLTVDPALAGDNKKGPAKGELVFGTALLQQEDIKALPPYVPVSRSFASQRIVVNPLLADVIQNPDTSLKKQDCYHTYKLLAAALDEFLISSISKQTQIVDDRVVITCQPHLPGELRYMPIFIDVSSLHIPTDVLKRGYLLTIGKAKINRQKVEDSESALLAAHIDTINTCLTSLDNTGLRCIALRQLNILQHLHSVSKGYYELLGAHAMPRSLLVNLSHLNEVYGPSAILREIRGHTTICKETPPHPDMRPDGSISQSHLQLDNLIRTANLAPNLRSVNLTLNLATKEKLSESSSKVSTSIQLSDYTTADLHDTALLKKLTQSSHSPFTPQSLANVKPNLIISSLSNLISMLSNVEKMGDLNVYEDIELSDEIRPSVSEQEKKEDATNLLTHRSTKQESGDDYSDEEEYPNTAAGNLRYLKTMIAPYLQPALASCMINCEKGISSERILQYIVQEMYKEFLKVNPNNSRADSSVEY